MSIHVNLEKIMIQKKMPCSVLSEKSGLSISAISALKMKRAKLVRFTTLEAICKALGCQPGDIMEYRYKEDDDIQIRMNHSNEI